MLSFFKKIIAVPVFFALIVTGTTAFSAAAEPAVLTHLRKSYDKAEDLSADFTQVALMTASGMEQKSSGSVVFKKGGKMRWSYDGEDPQILTSDGNTLWIHQIRDKTVLKQPISDLQPASKLALDLLSGFKGVESAFEISECGDNCLQLIPREASTELSSVTVETNQGGETVKSVATADALGNETKIEFTNIKLNTGVKDDFFSFSPPLGVQILNMADDAK